MNGPTDDVTPAPEPAAGVALDAALSQRLHIRPFDLVGASLHADVALGPLCDAMRARGWLLSLTQQTEALDSLWEAIFFEPEPTQPWRSVQTEAATPAEAISRAALAALQALDGEAGT